MMSGDGKGGYVAKRRRCIALIVSPPIISVSEKGFLQADL